MRSLFILLCSCLLWAQGNTQTADIILYNGKIFTADAKLPYVEAIAIKGNAILATGSNAAVTILNNTKTKKINLQGKM